MPQEASTTTSVELEQEFAKVALAIQNWLEHLRGTNGGYGHMMIEVKDGQVYRLSPTESLLASML